MSNRFDGFMTGMAALISILALAAAPAWAQAGKAPSPSKAWTQPKTPWGDPDIQGTWTSDDCIGTPMNRPARFGDRLYYATACTIRSRSSRNGRVNSQSNAKPIWWTPSPLALA